MERKFGREHHLNKTELAPHPNKTGLVLPHKTELAPRLATTAKGRRLASTALSSLLCAKVAGQTSPLLRRPSPNLGEGRVKLKIEN